MKDVKPLNIDTYFHTHTSPLNTSHINEVM